MHELCDSVLGIATGGLALQRTGEVRGAHWKAGTHVQCTAREGDDKLAR